MGMSGRKLNRSQWQSDFEWIDGDSIALMEFVRSPLLERLKSSFHNLINTIHHAAKPDTSHADRLLRLHNHVSVTPAMRLAGVVPESILPWSSTLR